MSCEHSERIFRRVCEPWGDAGGEACVACGIEPAGGVAPQEAAAFGAKVLDENAYV
jgi:hypothetical protein